MRQLKLSCAFTLIEPGPVVSAREKASDGHAPPSERLAGIAGATLGCYVQKTWRI
jgi:hypothetical protein